MAVTKEEASVLLIKKVLQTYKETKEDYSKALDNYKVVTAYAQALEDANLIDAYESYRIDNVYFNATTTYAGMPTHTKAIEQIAIWEELYNN